MNVNVALATAVRTSTSSARQTYRLGELFAGAGGMALGSHLAENKFGTFQHVWANDNDAAACATFAHNFHIASNKVICADVAKLDFKALANIDGLVFGFPCNDFSVVGERQGINGDYGGLYRWGIRALKIKQPLFFVAENVGGLASSGNDLELILKALRRVGYTVFPHTYKFEHYGVPQRRHRIIIVGFRNDLGVTEFAHAQPTTKDKPISCKTALAKISKHAPNHELTKQAPQVVERLKHIKPGENAFTAKLPKHLQLSLKSGAKLSQIYKRLQANQPAYTVTGSGGGGTHVYHWRANRALTNRERARLQSFPDSFVFQGTKESVRKQIGMAVPPEGARQIFLAVLAALQQYQIPSQS